MEDITSQDEEQARKQAQEQEEERKRQEELERTKEKARKQAIEQEREQQKKKGMGTGIKIAVSLIVLVIIVAVVALVTLSVSVVDTAPGASLPFTTNYGVTFPEGQTITIGNTHIIVLSYQNEIISDIDGEREKLVVGEDRVISERRAVITTLGVLTLMDTKFQINLKYKGNRDNVAYFDMAVHTSQQVPDYLLSKLLPAEIDARPI